MEEDYKKTDDEIKGEEEEVAKQTAEDQPQEDSE